MSSSWGRPCRMAWARFSRARRRCHVSRIAAIRAKTRKRLRAPSFGVGFAQYIERRKTLVGRGCAATLFEIAVHATHRAEPPAVLAAQWRRRQFEQERVVSENFEVHCVVAELV